MKYSKMPGLKAGRGLFGSGTWNARLWSIFNKAVDRNQARLPTRQWCTMKENNHGCKRYCAGSRSITATFLVALPSQRDSATISACCWRGLQKVAQQLVSHVISQPVCDSPPPPSFFLKRLLTPSILLHTESWREDWPLSTPVCIPTVQAILSCFPVSSGGLPPSPSLLKKKPSQTRRRNRRVLSPHLWQFPPWQAQ